jgi:polysaccharide biosynthesis/export protein
MRHSISYTVVESVLSMSIIATVIPHIAVAQLPDSPTADLDNALNERRPSTESTADLTSGLRVVPEDFSKLKLAPGFLLKLSVLDDPDFTGQYRVDEQGSISVPVLGSLHVGGLTADQAREQVSKRLLDGQILKEPQVSLTVLEYTAPQVVIIGEVALPGKYALLQPTNLVHVLALAGGPTRLAGDEVQITPGDENVPPSLVHYSKASDPKSVADVIVHPGDTVQVKRAGIVYVLGAVNRPGGYIMQEEGTLNVLQAISLANGTSMAASTKHIYLLRHNPDGTEIDMELAYKKIYEGKLTDLQLHATDVLFVPTSKMKSIFTSSQSILASAASASIYAAAVY